MYRLLALDVGFFEGADPARSSGEIPWVHWLVEALRPFPDVRVALYALHNMGGEVPEALGLAGLAPRVLGMAFKLSQQDSLEAALRDHIQGARHHLAVVADGTSVPQGNLNVLVCEDGVASLRAKTALDSWLWGTRPTRRAPSGDKVPSGEGALILYLDFDGVLHHENVLWHPRRGVYAGPPGFVLFEHTALLEELLDPYPLMKIVLSTSWVRVLGYSRSVKRLPPGLRKRVIGATHHSEMYERVFAEKARGRQVLEDVTRRRPRDWLALDDTDEGWPHEQRGHVLITDEQLGISAPGMAEQIAAALERVHANATTAAA